MDGLLVFEKATCRKGVTNVINEISLTVHPGELLTVLGQSGSGKSTLLRMAVGLDELTSGRILFQDRDVLDWNVADLRRRMGLLLQLPYLFPGTVKDNLLYGPRIHRKTLQDETALAADLLIKVGLPNDLIDRRTSDLSVGQQMRVSLGRTLANQPEILLLDEPTASLDPQSEQHILNLIETLNRENGYTIVCVTHKIVSARALGGRCVVLNEGRITEDGPVNEILINQGLAS